MTLFLFQDPSVCKCVTLYLSCCFLNLLFPTTAGSSSDTPTVTAFGNELGTHLLIINSTTKGPLPIPQKDIGWITVVICVSAVVSVSTGLIQLITYIRKRWLAYCISEERLGVDGTWARVKGFILCRKIGRQVVAQVEEGNEEPYELSYSENMGYF